MWIIKMHYRVIALLSAIFILLIASGIGSAWTETRMSTNTYDQTQPSLWGNYIVWQDARNGGSDIYLTDMAKKIQTRVTANVVAENPFVSGSKIVWQDKRNGNWDIYMYEISTKKTTRITTNTADQTEPGAYGNIIVWSDTHTSPGPGIYMLNLSTKKETRIATNGYSPAIYGNNIVWCTEDANGVAKIMLYSISTKKTSVILSSGMIPFSLSIYGNRIVYNDMYTGMFTGMYDFSTKKNIQLPFTYIENPCLYSNKIVFQDARNGNNDIYMVTL